MQLLQTGQARYLAQIADRLGQPAVVGQRDEGFVNGVIGRVVVGNAPLGGTLLQALVQTLKSNTRLAVASGLTLESASIRSFPTSQWRGALPPGRHTPAVFAIGP